MSVQTQIARIESAKAKIIAAIERKGVDVPDGVKIEALPQYIDAIVCGSDTTVKAICGMVLCGQTVCGGEQ